MKEVERLGTAVVLIVSLGGCHSTQHEAGSKLPVASSHSVALPGAVTAADAPQAPSVSEASTTDLVQFRDAQHGVTFSYPSIWRPPQQSAALQQPAFASVAAKPIITQMFDPANTYYADTVLSSLSFSYTVLAGSDATSCAQVPSKAIQKSAQPATVTYGGTTYSEAQGGDAGMCHQLGSTVDSTLHGSTCYVFERDVMTICPYTKNNRQPRPLTTTEQRALARHLDAVMQSVRIDVAAR